METGGREIRRWRLIPCFLLAIGLLASTAYAVTLSELSDEVNQVVAGGMSEQDGNPEVLYDQRWWQLDRGFSLAVAGQLSWLYYRSAMLHPEAKEKRQQWLKKSVKLFS